jgi:capsular exopolysaccharide synthesis family protein
MPQAMEWVRAVRRHAWLCGGITMAVTLAVAGMTFSLPARYTAEAQVVVSPEAPDPLSPADTTRNLADSDVATFATLLQSRDLAALALQRMPPETPAADGKTLTESQRVDRFMAALTATPEERSRAIDLKFVDPDPDRAALALNTLVTAFQQRQVDETGTDLRRTSNWLSERASALRDRWLQAETRVGIFRAGHGLADGGSSPAVGSLVSQQIAHAAADLATAEANLAAAQARQQAMRGGGAAAAGEVEDSPAMVAMSSELSALEGRQAALHAEYGPQHPSVEAIDHQVAMARASLGGATSRARHAVVSEAQAAQAAVATLTANLARLKAMASGQSGSDVALMTLTNEAADARTAYEAFLARAKQLDDRTALVQPQLHFASHATPPGLPSFPNRPRFLFAGLLLGLAAGVGAALARDATRRGFSNVSRIGAALDMPLLSAVPAVAASARDLPAYVQNNPYSRAAESVRTLAAGLQFGRFGPDAPRSIVIASATAGEGKTTVAIWLAYALAAAGQRVLLIDGDHRRGTIADRLGGTPGEGFTELMSGAEFGTLVTRHATGAGFDYIGAGRPTARVLGAGELNRLRLTLDRCRDSYDLVIIDTPPLLAMTEALLFARAADATVFVCRWNSTARQAVTSSLDRLERAGANLIGVVLSMVDHARLALFSDEHSDRDVRLIEGYYHHH